MYEGRITLGASRILTPYLTLYGADTGGISGRGWIPEFANSPSKMVDLDTCGRGWKARHGIRNQQVSGSSPLAGSSVYSLKRDPSMKPCWRSSIWGSSSVIR